MRGSFLQRDISVIISDFNKKYDIIGLLTPKNLIQENQKFLEEYKKGHRYNPQYKYEDVNLNNLYEYEVLFSKILSTINVGNRIFVDIILEMQNTINLIKNIGSPTITSYAKKAYGFPNQDILNAAHGVIRNRLHDKKDNKEYSAQYLSDIFRKRLSDYNFSWTITITPNLSSSIAVDFDNSEIYLNKNDMFSQQDIKRLQVHEIDTHVLRAENGKRQSDVLYRIGFPNFIETEEGLAAYSENQRGLLDEKTLRLYAGRVIGVDYALSHDFYSTFVYLSKYFDENECIRIVSRIKRGIEDTSDFGAFTKDYIYFSGYKTIVESLNSSDIALLYSGLVSYKYLDYIKAHTDVSKVIKPISDIYI